MTRRTIAAALAVLFTACGGDAAHPSLGTRVARSLGLVDPPPPPSITIETVCDPSKDSTCTPESLDATLAATLPAIADRPGSELRLWFVGPDVASITCVGTAKNTQSASGNANTARKNKARFVEDARAALLTAAQPFLTRNERGGSPIAEALTTVAMTGVRTDSRSILVVSDTREVSPVGGDFECDDPLPTPQSFAKTLQRARLLPPASLAGVRVFFTYVAITPIHRKQKGCVETHARLAQIKDLWTAAVEAAGGSAQFDTGTIDPAALALKKGDN